VNERDFNRLLYAALGLLGLVLVAFAITALRDCQKDEGRVVTPWRQQ
jgi:hypothetical protein